MIDVFVSYAREDRERAVWLVDVLERSGFSVWWDRDLVTGQNWQRELESASGRRAAWWSFGAGIRWRRTMSGKKPALRGIKASWFPRCRLARQAAGARTNGPPE